MSRRKVSFETNSIAIPFAGKTLIIGINWNAIPIGAIAQVKSKFGG